mgnify:CR=1 FL=1
MPCGSTPRGDHVFDRHEFLAGSPFARARDFGLFDLLPVVEGDDIDAALGQALAYLLRLARLRGADVHTPAAVGARGGQTAVNGDVLQNAREELPVLIVTGRGRLTVVFVGIEDAIAVGVFAEEDFEGRTVHETEFVDCLEGAGLVAPRGIELGVGVVGSGGVLRIGAAPTQNRVRHFRRHPGQRLQHAAEDLARGRVVIHHQRAQSARRARGGRRLGADAEARGEPEAAALARFAVRADLAAHQLDQALADGQPEADAAVLAGVRFIDLGEGLEQPREIGRGDADAAVADVEPQQRAPVALLRQADLALYAAKATGRGCFAFFSPDMNERLHERKRIESSLRNAAKRGEISLVFQPQFCLRTSRLVGVESLMRWNHANLGPVSPARFIPVAEECGLILELGELALRESCRQGRLWFERGWLDARIAVNLSPAQFAYQDLTELVNQILDETGLPARCLELEITEGMLMRDRRGAEATLEALHRCGVTLALDDFGVGYSSLSYLKRFSLDKLKIDRSFVSHLPQDAGDAAIARTMWAWMYGLIVLELNDMVRHPKGADPVKEGITFFTKMLKSGEHPRFDRRLSR